MSKEEMQKVADEIAAEFNLPKAQKDIPCPNCYGGHFRPCQWCGDTGRVDFVPNSGTQRPGTPDGPIATETRKPGSLK